MMYIQVNVSFRIIFMLISCLLVETSIGQVLHGNGYVARQERSVEAFNQLEINGGFNVFINQSDSEALTIETEDNLFDVVETNVVDGKLVLHVKKGVTLRSPTKINIYVSLINLNQLDVKGTGNVQFITPVESKMFELKVTGQGNIKLDVVCTELQAHLKGEGNVKMKGSAEEMNIVSSVTGNIKAFEFISKKLTIINKGVGNIQVYASDEISIENTGVGHITYKGNPRIKKISNTGVGSIEMH